MPIAPGTIISCINLTIESIIKQTYSNWHIYICVPNDTEDIIGRIRCISTIGDYIILPKNFVSKYDTINYGVDIIKSEWIAIIEPGDEWYSNKLEKQLEYSNKYDIIGTGCRFYGARAGMPDISYYKIKSEDFIRGRTIIDNTIIMKKHLCRFNTKYGIHSDYRMFCKHFINGIPCYNIPEVLTVCKISSRYDNDVLDLEILKKLKRKYMKQLHSNK